MKKILLASALGAVVMFMWGAISWMVLPFHKSTMNSFTNEDAIVAVLKSTNPESGAYMIPGYANTEEGMNAKAATGPIAHIYYQAEGQTISPMFFVKGILLDFIVLLLAVSMLSKISWSLATYGNRVKFMMMIGLIIALSARLGDTIYFGYPIGFSLLLVVDEIIVWTLMGLIVGKIMKPALKGA